MNPQLYTITENVLDTYRRRTKRGNRSSKEVIERKLSAIIANARDSEQCEDDKNKTKYFFANFFMITNEEEKCIFWIEWLTENQMLKYGLSKEKSDLLKEYYNYFGLSNSGNSFKTKN